MKRTNSLPAHLPSHPRQPTDVRPIRNPITRPSPDQRSPREIKFGSRTRAGAGVKKNAMEQVQAQHFLKKWLVPEIERSPDYMECLKSMHPKIEHYTWEKKAQAYQDLAYAHPKLRADIARKRNVEYAVPNYATSSRVMNPLEQKFLSAAMGRIQNDVARKPFHMHGESGLLGDQNGNIVQFNHEPRGSVSFSIKRGDKYALHSHPPFMEPFTSSASEPDHKVAAADYLQFNNWMAGYVTNGKDVLHIQPASLELVKLIPDPRVEHLLGKFPEAFRLPTPQEPPRPFSNHEAPAAFKKDWAPPAGWKPPEDYPRGAPSEKPRRQRT